MTELTLTESIPCVAMRGLLVKATGGGRLAVDARREMLGWLTEQLDQEEIRHVADLNRSLAGNDRLGLALYELMQEAASTQIMSGSPGWALDLGGFVVRFESPAGVGLKLDLIAPACLQAVERVLSDAYEVNFPELRLCEYPCFFPDVLRLTPSQLRRVSRDIVADGSSALLRPARLSFPDAGEPRSAVLVWPATRMVRRDRRAAHLAERRAEAQAAQTESGCAAEQQADRDFERGVADRLSHAVRAELMIFGHSEIEVQVRAPRPWRSMSRDACAEWLGTHLRRMGDLTSRGPRNVVLNVDHRASSAHLQVRDAARTVIASRELCWAGAPIALLKDVLTQVAAEFNLSAGPI